MKTKSIIFVSLLFFGSMIKGFSQQSASGYILFGKNKTESGVVCTQNGICRLQQLADPEMVGVTFSATPLGDMNTEYTISMTLNIDELLAKQPDQSEYFVNPKFPYTVDDKFVLPKWLLTALGFDAAKNRGVSMQPPISLGIPVANAQGMVTMTFSSTLKINR